MRTIFLATFVALITTTASASTTVVTDHYKTVVKQIPYTQETCRLVDVPVYGTVGSEPTTGDILTGAIIGGVIGNNIKGEKNGGAAGAVIGGLLGANNKNKKQTIVGYRQEEQCNTITEYTRSTEEVYDYSTVRFTDGGREYTLRFKK